MEIAALLGFRRETVRHRGDSDDNICSGENLVVSSREEEDSCWSKGEREKALYLLYSTLRYQHFVVLLPLIRNGAIGKDGSQHPESNPNARGMMTMTKTRAEVDSGSGCVTRSSAALKHLPARPQREKQCNDLASLPYSFRCCEDALKDDFTRISGLG